MQSSNRDSIRVSKNLNDKLSKDLDRISEESIRILKLIFK